MKNNLIVLAIFGIGCLVGAGFQPEADMHNWSLCILYALMLQVGIGIGSNRGLQQELKKLSPKMLLVPAATIIGTLAFSAAASLLLSQWSVFDCMAVGSGFAYYSLSSILITQFKEPSIGLQLATELGTIALLSNIIRTGIISEVDEESWCVRVRSGELETGWLRWNTTRAGAFNVWLPPSPGEQVVIACIGGNPETAMIIGSLWSDASPAPGKSLKEIVVSAPDGAVFRYDADAGALSASGMKTATLQASVSVTLDTPVVECTNLLRTATLDVTKGGKMSGNITHSGGDFTSNGITVHTHKHGGVKGGSDSTGGPQ